MNRVYIQYGCGPLCEPQHGWLNYDVSPALRFQRLPIIGKLFLKSGIAFGDGILYGDIVKGLPHPDDTAEGVYASHVLEHLSLSDCSLALRNTFRLLKAGGIFRLIVPDLEVRAKKYLAKLHAGDPEANSWFMRKAHLGKEYRQRGLGALLRASFGNSDHLWMWDESSMIAALKNAGFAEIRRCHFGDSTEEAFRLVENEGRFFDKESDLEECAMEAVKPNSARI